MERAIYSAAFRRYVRWARKERKRARWFAQASLLAQVAVMHLLDSGEVKAASAPVEEEALRVREAFGGKGT